MRTCGEYEDMISAFIDGALAERDRAALMEHMAACPACQGYFDQQIALHDALLADAEAICPPEDFAADVMARVRFTPQEKRKQTAVRWQRWAALAACCALAALALWRGGAGTRQVDVATGAADRPAVQAEDFACADRAAEAAEEESGMDAAVPEAAPERDDGLKKEAAPEAPAPAAVLDSGPADASGEAGSAAASEIAPLLNDAPQTAAGAPAEGKRASPEQWTAGDSGLQSAPAADTPEMASLDDEALAAVPETASLGGGLPAAVPEAAKAPCTILTASPAAVAWVEESLGLTWTAGERYALTAGEYAQLLEILEAAGEDFTEQPGDEDAGQFLLIAENSAETD